MACFERVAEASSMKKTKSEQINRLLDAMQEAQAKQSFNIVEDLNGLKDALTYLKTRELKKKIDGLVEKYSATEFAAVHAALIDRCRAGDVNAIRLYNDLQREDKTDDTAANNLLQAIVASTGGGDSE